MKNTFFPLLIGALLCTSSFAQDVVRIPIVVHVLYNDVADSIPAGMIETIILDSVNADFRRQNADTVFTQTAYRPIAADTEIEFRFAETDPQGDPTSGILYRHTDTQTFNWDDNRGMMYDSLGGSDPWDQCHYLNIWICPMGHQVQYANSWEAISPVGIAVGTSVVAQSFSKYYRFLTHEFAHFLQVPPFRATPQCLDDGIHDTPVQSSNPHPAVASENPDSIFVETTCDPIPEGKLAGNFMMVSNGFTFQYMNMFTLGQKERMRSFIFEQFPGYTDPAISCFTSVKEVRKGEFKVYPNPSTGRVSITVERPPDGDAVLSVHDLTGRELMRRAWPSTGSTSEMLDLPRGMYFVTLTTEAWSSSRKIVIR